MRLWLAYVVTWPAATRVLSRGRKREDPGIEVVSQSVSQSFLFRSSLFFLFFSFSSVLLLFCGDACLPDHYDDWQTCYIISQGCYQSKKTITIQNILRGHSMPRSSHIEPSSDYTDNGMCNSNNSLFGYFGHSLSRQLDLRDTFSSPDFPYLGSFSEISRIPLSFVKSPHPMSCLNYNPKSRIQSLMNLVRNPRAPDRVNNK